MTRFAAPFIAIVSLAAAPAAMAQGLDITGGSVSATGTYIAAGPGSLNIEQVAGTAEVALSPSTFFEADVAATRFGISGTGLFAGAATGHLGYRFANESAVGVFASYADATTPAFPALVTLGAEVTAPVGPVQVEAYGAYTFLTGGVGPHVTHLDAFARYPVNDRFSFGVGGHYATSNIPLSFFQARATARYEIADSLFVEAGYGYTRFNAGPSGLNSIGLSLTKTFGQGASFSPRNQLAMFTGF